MSLVNASTSHTTRTLAFEAGRHVHGSLKRCALWHAYAFVILWCKSFPLYLATHCHHSLGYHTGWVCAHVCGVCLLWLTAWCSSSFFGMRVNTENSYFLWCLDLQRERQTAVPQRNDVTALPVCIFVCRFCHYICNSLMLYKITA